MNAFYDRLTPMRIKKVIPIESDETANQDGDSSFE
jgi:hypothetical protein